MNSCSNLKNEEQMITQIGGLRWVLISFTCVELFLIYSQKKSGLMENFCASLYMFFYGWFQFIIEFIDYCAVWMSSLYFECANWSEVKSYCGTDVNFLSEIIFCLEKKKTENGDFDLPTSLKLKQHSPKTILLKTNQSICGVWSL